MDQSLMDELFERIKVLEEENKILEQEYTSIDNELNKKKAELSAKNFLTDKEKAEIEKKMLFFSKSLTS